MHKKEVITGNTDEVIQDEELDSLLEEEESPTIYAGYETSGPIHLGHWISIKKLLDSQEAGLEPKVLLADRHTYLNEKGKDEWSDKKRLNWIDSMTDYWQETMKSLGLDAEYVRGSEYQNSKEYKEDLWKMARNTSLNRAKRSVGQVANGNNLKVAQIKYPLMQALDIPHLEADIALGGTDQRKIHMLAREELPKIGYEKPICIHYPLITSFNKGNEKMSSSHQDSMFSLHASPDSIRKTIENAYCSPQEDKITKNNPLLQISKSLVLDDISDSELHIDREERYGGPITYTDYDNLVADFGQGELHPEDLKNGLSNYLINELKPVRESMKDKEFLLNPLEEVGYQKPCYVS